MSTKPKAKKMRTPERIRIPVRYIDGHWELAYGGAIKVHNGSEAELVIAREHFNDAAMLAALTEKRWVRILDQGTELRIALTVKGVLDFALSNSLVRDTKVWPSSNTRLGAGDRFVAISLGPPTTAQQKRNEGKGGLWLALEGVEPRSLESSAVYLPTGLNLDPAISVNHAFTALSEIFEPWRKSHTGNIYDRVFYKEDDGYWYPLDDLRKKETSKSERKIVRALWAEVERLLTNPL